MTPTRSPNMAKLAEVRRSIRECPRNPSGSPTWAAMDDMATDYALMGLLEVRLERERKQFRALVDLALELVEAGRQIKADLRRGAPAPQRTRGGAVNDEATK
jgi:hypothetical protein